jgi:hypothetical protein
MRSIRKWLGIGIVCLAASGCSWSLNDQDADTDLRFYLPVSSVFVFDQSGQVSLRFDWWDPAPIGAVYTLERAAPGETFHPVASFQAGENSIVLGPDDPAGAYQFRLRRGTSGKPSKAVSYFRPVLQGQLTLLPVSGGFSLAYAAPPQLPDALVLTRATQLANGTRGTAKTLLTTTARSGTYVDTDLSELVDGASYVYALTFRSGGVDAQQLTQKTASAAASLPEIVSVQTNGAAVHVQVRSTSELPGTLRLVRGSELFFDALDPLAIFQATGPGQLFSADDLLPGPTRYEYQVSFTPQGSGFPLATKATSSTVLPPPHWTGKMITVPLFVEAARASTGELALLADVGGVRTLIAPGGTAAEGFAVPSSYHPNRLLLDAADHPHAVYADGALLVHVFLDGQSWQKETIGTFALGTPAEVTVGADGDLWATWAGTDTRIFVAHRTAAGWSVEELPPDFVATKPLIIAADESSNPHLAGGDTSLFHVFRDDAGWHQETLAAAGGLLNVHSPSYIAAVSQKITVVDREAATPFPGGSPEVSAGIGIYRHDSTGWTNQGFGATGGLPANAPFLHAAIGPDPFIVSWTEVGQFIETSGRPESLLIFAEGYEGMPCGIGFKPDGTRWLLYLFRTLGDFQIPSGFNAALYEETQ